MDGKIGSIDDFLAAVLRGAAKIIGCNSTNLIVINEKTGDIRLRVVTPAMSYPVIAQLEGILGSSFTGFSFPIHKARSSLVVRAWRENAVYETGSFAELLSDTLPVETVTQIEQLIGEHRFIIVPALSNRRSYGVLLLEKEGIQPFSLQQRELVLRYARRIGEIIENDLMGQGQLAIALPRSETIGLVLFDSNGGILGHSTGMAAVDTVPPDLVERAVTFLSADAAHAPASNELAMVGESSARLFRFDLNGQKTALCQIQPQTHTESLENQLLQLALGAAAPTVFVDPSFLITSCNTATEKLLGYPANEIVGQPIDILFRNPTQIHEILNRQMLASGNPRMEEPVVIRRQDQSIAEARVETMLLADDRGRVVGFLVLIRASLDERGATLEHLVQQERMATMGEMAAQLAHELRNPLLAVGASLDSLCRETEALALRERLVTLGREITRLDMILKKYLAVRREHPFAEVRLHEVLTDARLLLEAAHKKAGKQIVVDINPTVSVLGDYESIKHLIFNLMLNALEASPPNTTVTCRVRETDRDVTMLIEDNGTGLTAPAEECFRPFFTTKKNGTGLGLAVCQKIAAAHGGLVDLRNRQGGGCQAMVVLPRRLDKEARA
jgi:PAS domain S-box-containing protein